MQRFGRVLLASLWWVLVAGILSTAAWGEQIVTTTLLPFEVKHDQVPGKSEDLLWIRNSPRHDVFLQFDLSGLPEGLSRQDFRRCTLRLVASDVTYDPNDNKNAGATLVLVKGQLAKHDFSGDAAKDSIVALATLSKKNRIAMNEKASGKFVDAVFKHYAQDKKITLRLFSGSHKASTLFYYKDGADGATPSDIPRLVIEYRTRPQTLLETLAWPQYQHDPEHTGRSPWRPSRTPTGFSLHPIPVNGKGSIASFPLVYKGNLYLVYKAEEINYLVALNFKGTELWRTNIGKGTAQRSPVISRAGIFHVLWEDNLARYDLSQAGKFLGDYKMNKATAAAYTDLTMGNDGSLFLALKQDDKNYIYGHTPHLQRFFSAGPFGSGQEKISTVSVSADGRNVFAQNPSDARVADLHDPTAPRKIELSTPLNASEAYYHTPVAGPAEGVMMFANYSGKAEKGKLWGVLATLKPIWDSSSDKSLLSQPVLGSDGKVYFIQDGGVKGHAYNGLGVSEKVTSNDANLNTTSNLVVDGADNLYFWNSGTIWGVDTHTGKAVFTNVANDPNGQTLYTGLEKFQRLTLGPDGTLWANNNNGKELFAIKPRYAEPDLPVKQEDIKTQTYYRTENELRAGSLKLDAGSQLLFQAGKSIRLGKGFTVRKGTSLLCRTGF